jgi:CheY-like chemotaxis protein
VREAGFAPRFVHSGEAALTAFDDSFPDKPAGLVLDVGIPEVLAFDVVASLRQRPTTQKLPIVLLASVFDQTRYKRRPTSLHGADAYLELHHIPDRLAKVLQTLVKGEVVDEAMYGHTPQEHARALTMRHSSSTQTAEGVSALARRIVSDIALYNEKDLQNAILSKDSSKLLEDIFAEGRKYFVQVSSTYPVEGTPFEDAVAVLVESLRRRNDFKSGAKEK